MCKDLGFKRAKFMSSGSYFGSKSSDFSVKYMHCGEKDDHLLDCYVDNREQNCESGTGAGVICE